MQKYSWKPDIPDGRDFYFKASAKPKALPKFVPRIGMGNQIEDQGQLGSCTGNSSTSALEIVLKADVQYSRLMAYYNARVIDGTVNQDAGAYIRSAIKGLVKTGVSTEPTWPYKVKKFKTKPSAAAFKEAKELITGVKLKYARVESLQALKEALSKGIPVVFGFAVPESFENLSGSYVLKLPKAKEAFLGGHAVVAVGYDDRPKTPFVWVRNSWSADWGLDGYFKMTQDWFTDSRRLCDDLWCIHT